MNTTGMNPTPSITPATARSSLLKRFGWLLVFVAASLITMTFAGGCDVHYTGHGHWNHHRHWNKYRYCPPPRHRHRGYHGRH